MALTEEERRKRSDEIEQVMKEASRKATLEKAEQGELTEQQISNVLTHERYSTEDRVQIISAQSEATGKPVELTPEEHQTFTSELTTYQREQEARREEYERSEAEFAASGGVRMTPDEAYEAGLISERERARGKREDLTYQSTSENIKLSREAKSELRSRYPAAQVSPGITPFQKLYALEDDRSRVVQNIASNPIVRASYVFDKDTLGMGTVSEVAVAGLTGQDWEAKREQMMVSYSEELLGRNDAFMAGAEAAIKTGAVTTLFASTGGLGIGGTTGAKVATVGATAVKVTYGVGLGLQYGETIKTVMDPEATGEMKAEEVARSFVYTAPAAVTGLTRVTKPLGVKTAKIVSGREGKMFKGMAGGSSKQKTTQKTKTKTTTKKDTKKAERVARTMKDLKEGRAKIIKVQTKRGLERRIVSARKTSGEKHVDRVFRKIKKQHTADKKSTYVDKQTFEDMRRLGLIDKAGHRVKSRVDIKKYFDSKDAMYNKQTAARFHRQTYGKEAFKDSKSPDVLRPVDHGTIKVKPRPTQKNWWDRQIAGRERVQRKQKIPRVEYDKLQQRKAAKKLEASKMLEAVDQRELVQDLGMMTVTKQKVDQREKPKERAKEATALMPVSTLSQNVIIDNKYAQKQDSVIKEAQKQDQIQDAATEPGVDLKYSRGGGPSPGPPPPPPPPPPPMSDFIPRKMKGPGRPDGLPKTPSGSVPTEFKLPYMEFPEPARTTGNMKNINTLDLKYFYTPSLVGVTKAIPVVKEAPYLAKKGFGFRPMEEGWVFGTDTKRKKSKKRRKR